MALTVEDGSGLANADSLASVAEADAYHAARDNDAWFDLAFDSKEAKLREATDYVSLSYDWKGWLTVSTQAQAWPRSGVYDHEGRAIASDSVPTRVKNAVIYLAGASGTSALQPSTAATATGVKRRKVSDIEIEFFEGGGSTVKRQFPEANAMLKGLYVGSAGGINGRLERWS